mgnify:CR=1 FL=1
MRGSILTLVGIENIMAANSRYFFPLSLKDKPGLITFFNVYYQMEFIHSKAPVFKKKLMRNQW